MDRRFVSRLALSILCVSCVCGVSHAELNLWVPYYYAGHESYDAADYADAEQLLLEARPEAKSVLRDAFTPSTFRTALYTPWQFVAVEKRPRDAYVLNALGLTYAAAGEYGSAERCYTCAIRILEKSLGKKCRDLPMVLNNLADLHYIAGDIDKCEPLYRRSMKIQKRDQRNIEVCHALNGMALLHNDKGEYVQAEKLLKRAIDIHVKSQRREHPYLATVLVNLGALMTNLERFEEAEPLFDQAEYIQGRALREEHPDVAIRLHAQAALFAKTGRVEEARKATEQANCIQAKQAEKDPLAL